MQKEQKPPAVPEGAPKSMGKSYDMDSVTWPTFAHSEQLSSGKKGNYPHDPSTYQSYVRAVSV